MRKSVTATVVFLACICNSVFAAWEPGAWSKLDTLEFETVGPSEGEHWSTVWFVVIDDQVYIRLGAKAAERMRKNTKARIVRMKISGQQFERVVVQDASEKKAAVNERMAAKYPSDALIRYFDHPMTLRLLPEATVPPATK